MGWEKLGRKLTPDDVGRVLRIAPMTKVRYTIRKVHLDGSCYAEKDRDGQITVTLLGPNTQNWEIESEDTIDPLRYVLSNPPTGWTTFDPYDMFGGPEEEASVCVKHEAVSFGSKRGYCKHCDADMIMDDNMQWKIS